ncbi:MAG: BfmA/BtgA family mobilization protein [Pricia sp.]
MKVQFGRINFRMDTLTRFRSFSRAHGKTHSDVLEGMMDFFTKYQMSPFQDFGPNIRGMEANIKKRINAVVAIIKEIEKHQTKPTTSMLQLLFEGTTPKKKQPELLLEEITDVENEDDFFGSPQAIKLREEKNKLVLELEETRQQFEDILYGKIEVVSPSFGREKLKLHLTVEEYKQLKEQFKNGP